MRSVVETYVFVGGPADGRKIAIDTMRDNVKIEEVGGETYFYERAIIAAEDADYAFMKLSGMSASEVMRRLFTRYQE